VLPSTYIAAGVAVGGWIRAIARRLNRPPSTISRELARYGHRNQH
jgi:IS30 family transposase